MWHFKTWLYYHYSCCTVVKLTLADSSPFNFWTMQGPENVSIIRKVWVTLQNNLEWKNISLKNGCNVNYEALTLHWKWILFVKWHTRDIPPSSKEDTGATSSTRIAVICIYTSSVHPVSKWLINTLNRRGMRWVAAQDKFFKFSKPLGNCNSIALICLAHEHIIPLAHFFVSVNHPE